MLLEAVCKKWNEKHVCWYTTEWSWNESFDTMNKVFLQSGSTDFLFTVDYFCQELALILCKLTMSFFFGWHHAIEIAETIKLWNHHMTISTHHARYGSNLQLYMCAKSAKNKKTNYFQMMIVKDCKDSHQRNQENKDRLILRRLLHKIYRWHVMIFFLAMVPETWRDTSVLGYSLLLGVTTMYLHQTLSNGVKWPC